MSTSERHMSASISSTEVGSTSGTPNEQCPVDQTTVEQESTSPETPGEADGDSLTNDYVHVESVPDIESDEIQNLSNQPSLLAGYLGYLPSIPSIPLQLPVVLGSVLPAWLYPASVADSAAISNSNTDFETWLKETISYGAYTGSIEEEQRFRACLIEAILEHFNNMNSIDVKFLAGHCSVTKEEMCYALASESQCVRRLLLMLLNRDTRTILLFLFGLLSHDNNVVERIVLSLNQHLTSGIRNRSRCSRCTLRERVCISLISDHLPECDSGLLAFVNIMSEEDQPARPSVSERLWNQLFTTITDEDLYMKVIGIIIQAIQSSGYQTDIVRMLNEDMNMNRNSFICRCKNMRNDEDCDLHESQKNTESSVTHELHVLVDGVRNSPDETHTTKEEIEQIQNSNYCEVDPVPEQHSGNEYADTRNEQMNTASTLSHDACRYSEEMERLTKRDVKTGNKHAETVSNKDKILDMKPPESGHQLIRKSNPRRSKRKGVSGGKETKEKRRRNDDEGQNNGSYASANCDLQMELLNLAEAEQEIFPDSDLSLASTTSFSDSGISSYGDNSVTIPKQLAFDYNASRLYASKDKSADGDLEKLDNDTSRFESKPDKSSPTHAETESDPSSTEEKIEENSEESHDLSVDIETDYTDDMPTMTKQCNDKKK